MREDRAVTNDPYTPDGQHEFRMSLFGMATMVLANQEPSPVEECYDAAYLRRVTKKQTRQKRPNE